MKKFVIAIAAVLVLALPSSSLGAATIAVKITATGFTPKTVSLDQGDTVKWTNVDRATHQLVANNGAFASHILKPGDTYSFTFNAAGRYAYHDALKPSLTGTITVKGPPPSVSLAVSAPIVTYGEMTVISGAVSSAKAKEPGLILAQP